MDPGVHFLVCIAAEGEDDLQVLKVYRRLPDELAQSHGYVRVIDDSGEDYLYSEARFVPLPPSELLDEKLPGLIATPTGD